jgi:hypothetical protein
MFFPAQLLKCQDYSCAPARHLDFSSYYKDHLNYDITGRHSETGPLAHRSYTILWWSFCVLLIFGYLPLFSSLLSPSHSTLAFSASLHLFRKHCQVHSSGLQGPKQWKWDREEGAVLVFV